MIDFDVRIEDPDGAISSDKVYLEARDRTGNLVYVDELRINYEYQRITIDKLDANETYTFKYTVEEYNIGFDNSTFEDNKTLYSEDIVTKFMECVSLCHSVIRDEDKNIPILLNIMQQKCHW